MKKKNKKSDKDLEKQILNEFESLFIEDEIINDFEKHIESDFREEVRKIEKAKKSLRNKMQYAITKANQSTTKKEKEKYEKIRLKRMRSLAAINSEEEEILKSYDRETKREKRDRLQELRDNDFEYFNADFSYGERKEIMDFIFNNVEVKYFKGKKIKYIADIIAKKIDSLLQKLSYSQVLIIQLDGNNIRDIFNMDLEEFESM